MRDPIYQFKDEVGNTETKASALKRKKFFNVAVPLFFVVLVVAGVIVLMQETDSAAVMVTDDAANRETPTEMMQLSAIADVVEQSENEKARLTELSEDAKKAQDDRTTRSGFSVGEIVVPAGECLGFSEESDLSIFRTMLKHQDTAKARKFYEQQRKGRKSGKIAADEEMVVLSIAWNGSVLVEVGAEHWWVAPEWVKYPAAELEN